MPRYVLRFLVASLCLAAVSRSDDIPIRVAKETTYVTEPLTPEGFVDLAAAINNRLSQGITADTNAAAVVFYWIGPEPEGTRLAPLFYQELGIDVPPDAGNYFRPFGEFLDRHESAPGLIPRDAAFEQQGVALSGPWQPDELPLLAAWLDAQREPLRQIVSGLRRNHYFAPLVPEAPGAVGQGLIGALLPHVQMLRSLSRALLARAMLRLGQGHPDDAWEDIVATLRLGRHTGHGPSVIDRLVGIAIEQQAHAAALTLIAQTHPNRVWVQHALNDLARLPARASVADTIALTERLTYIDVVVMLSTDVGEREELLGLEDGLLQLKRILQSPWMETPDWNETLRVGNAMYDRVVEAMRQASSLQRFAALELLNAEFSRMKGRLTGREFTAEQFDDSAARPKLLGRTTAEVLLSLLVPALLQVETAQSRSIQTHDNLRIALALAAFHATYQTYPQTLDALAPEFLPEVPQDLFAGSTLMYQKTDEGCRFYSVGPDRKDNHGRSYEDGADDLVMTLPAAPASRSR